ncbi:hypothetical protein LEMLEM_LOCUS27533 [Lemmus lemmus]
MREVPTCLGEVDGMCPDYFTHQESREDTLQGVQLLFLLLLLQDTKDVSAINGLVHSQSLQPSVQPGAKTPAIAFTEDCRDHFAGRRHAGDRVLPDPEVPTAVPDGPRHRPSAHAWRGSLHPLARPARRAIREGARRAPRSLGESAVAAFSRAAGRGTATTFHLSGKMSEEFINAGRQPFSGKSSDLDLPAGQKLLFLTGSSTNYEGCAACFPPVIAHASEDCQGTE